MATIQTLASGASQDLTFTYTIKESDIGKTDLKQTVTASSDTATIQASSPAINIEAVRKTITVTVTRANNPADGSAYAKGEAATFNIAVKNTGNQTLTNVVVSAVTSGATVSNGTIASLGIGATSTVTGSYTIQQSDLGKTNLAITFKATSGTVTAQGASPVLPVKSAFPTTDAEFKALSWAEIDAIGATVRANPSNYKYMIGWTKDITFGNPINKTVTHEIVDICHTDYGTNHAFVFMPKEQVLGTAQQTSSTNTANKKYTDSLIDAGLQSGGTYWSALPSDLSSVMKNCNIKYFTSTSSGGWSGISISTTTRKWFLPALVEVGEDYPNNTNYNNEGKVFAKFTSASNNDRIRKNGSSAISWWLRSLGSWGNGLTAFGGIGSNGAMKDFVSTETNGVVPVFAV